MKPSPTDYMREAVEKKKVKKHSLLCVCGKEDTKSIFTGKVIAQASDVSMI